MEEGQRLFETQPERAPDRPPTRAEAWEYAQHYYRGLKDETDLKAYAKALFVGNYVYYVNFLGWTYPPDWREGETVVEAARPTKPFPAGSGNGPEVYRLLALQKGEA
jgi:hypothetical protein